MFQAPVNSVNPVNPMNLGAGSKRAGRDRDALTGASLLSPGYQATHVGRAGEGSECFRRYGGGLLPAIESLRRS